MIPGLALLAPPAAAAADTRPTALPVLAAGPAYRGWYDATAAANVARDGSNLVSSVANSVTTGSPLGALSVVNASYKPTYVPGAGGLDFHANRARPSSASPAPSPSAAPPR